MKFNIPACSISNEIEEIVSLCEKFSDARVSQFYLPAIEEDILAWEQTNGIVIPETYKEWLRFSNGAQIHGRLAWIFGVNKIEVGDGYIPEHLVYIGDLIGDGERLCFEKETGRFVSFINVYIEEDLRIYNDFKEFLYRIINFLKDDGSDYETEPKEEKEMSYELNVKLIEFLKTMKNSPEGLTEEQASILADLELTLKERQKFED